MKDMFRRIRIMTVLFLLALSVCVSGTAEVFVNREKPEGWEERKILTVIVAETVYNDAFIIQQGEHAMLVDGGASKHRKRILKYLQEHDLTEPEIYFNSHPHDDHLEAVWKMIRGGEFHPGRFISLFPREYRNQLQQKTIKALAEHDIPYNLVRNESEFDLGEAHFTVFQYEEGNDPNELSGVLLLRCRDATMLLTADLPGKAQHWFLKNYKDRIRADILKVPHHGIQVMVPEFLQAVNPSFAFVTSRSRATEDVNKQLKKNNIPYMHHSIGSIIMETDGTDWYVEQVKDLI